MVEKKVPKKKTSRVLTLAQIEEVNVLLVIILDNIKSYLPSYIIFSGLFLKQAPFHIGGRKRVMQLH